MLVWWQILLLLVWGGICNVWIGLLIVQVFVRRRGIFLEPQPDAPLVNEPSVAIIIPARNEAANIAECIRSVQSQSYDRLHIIVADDRSQDETAAIVADLARHDARILLVQVKELPSGWMGKSHALWQASRQVSADWLLFIDADCRLDSAAVRTAILTAQTRNVEFLSLWPRQADGGFWEHLLIPLCAGIIALWYGSPQHQTTPRRLPFANGQFLLVSRGAYDRMGGHAAVRSALIEDVILVQRAVAQGISAWAGSGARLFSVRMYTSLSEIMSGWSRIFVGALRSRVRIAISVLWLLLGSLLPYLALIWVALAAAFNRWTPFIGLIADFAAAHLLLIMLASIRFWAYGKCRRIYLFAYPLSVIMVSAILFRAERTLTGHCRVRWRDTEYELARAGMIL
jgi:glycosyltransferase involved in cell wall biosynthesis